MSHYLDELNDIQRKAATTTEGPVMVIAGPGSGKTRMLTYRMAHLIHQGAAPWEILALTFTNKAAREMKARIAQVVGPQADRIWAGTFHSIFSRWLRTEAAYLGFPTTFTIYDTDDTKSVIQSLIKENNLDKEKYNVNAVRSRISFAKSRLITPERYKSNEELMQFDRRNGMSMMGELYTMYMARCKRAGAMDFDDLLLRLHELFAKNAEVLEKYRNKFRYIMVDEFQDTNELQYAIIKQLSHYPGSTANICVVGDDAQSIYAFRGATIDNILNFEADYKTSGIKVFKLEQNYRSTNAIVEAANTIIVKNSKQIPKTIWSSKGEGPKIKLVMCMTDQEEGKRVADLIIEQKNRFHLRSKEIAILYRTNAQSRSFEEALRRNNLSYRVYGGMSFYQRKEIKDLLAYLRLVVNPKDEEALKRVINYPRRGIGESTVDKLSADASGAKVTMWEAMATLNITSRIAGALSDFRKIIADGVRALDRKDAYEMATQLYSSSGMKAELNADPSPEGQSRKENVQNLLDGIKEFVDQQSAQKEQGDPSLGAYLQQVSLLTDFDEKEKDDDQITLMSVHSAKGLEFKSVFVVGLEEKLFPSFMAQTAVEIDEERRLFYVAITRAEQLLTLTFAHSRYRHGKNIQAPPSRFLGELPKEVLETPSFGRMQHSSLLPEEDLAVATGPQRSGVSGAFRKPVAAAPVKRIPNFQAAPAHAIQPGMKVLHQKFGEGKVLNIDGANDNRMATIFFQGVENPQRRIMLKFAQLMILS